jgi:hypothetical protein
MKAVLRGKFRSALTFALMLWCAGAGCMIVSYAHAAAMSATDANSGSAVHASGSVGTHDCCKARHASEHRLASSTVVHTSSPWSLMDREAITDVPSSSIAVNCCPLTSGTFVVNSRERIVNENAPVSHGLEPATAVINIAETPLAIPLRLPDQNQTYLRGCVFLI